MRWYLTTMAFLLQEGSVQTIEIFNSYDMATDREEAVTKATASPKALDYFHKGCTLPVVISHPVPDYVEGGVIQQSRDPDLSRFVSTSISARKGIKHD